MTDLEAHRPRLTALVTRMVGSNAAEDVVQTTFLRALSAAGGPAAPVGAGWLVTVARNLAVDVLRDQVRVDAWGDEDAPVDVDAPEDDADAVFCRVLSGLDRLSPTELIVVLLRDGLDFTVEETAAALESSPGSVRVLHHRARLKAATPHGAADTMRAVDRFLTWLLARAVSGLPVTHGASLQPGFSAGGLEHHERLLDRIVRVARRGGRTDLLGRALFARGTARAAQGRTDAVEDLEAAWRAGYDPTWCAFRLAAQHCTRGRLEEARALAEGALSRGAHPDLEVSLRTVLVNACLGLDDADGARAHRAAIAALRSRADGFYEAVNEAATALEEERFGDALGPLEAALAVARHAGNRPNELALLNNLTHAWIGVGDLERARLVGAEALEQARRAGSLVREVQVRGNLAVLCLVEGRHDDAASGLQVVLADARLRDLPHEEALAVAWLAAVAHLRGHPRDALLALDAVRDRLERRGVPVPCLVQVGRFAVRADLGLTTVDEADATERAVGPNRRGVRQALAVYRALERREAPPPLPADAAPAARIAWRVVAARFGADGPRAR